MEPPMMLPPYGGYEIPVDRRGPYRAPVNESFRSERDPERERRFKPEHRRSASFHGGAARMAGDRHYTNNRAEDEFNRLYSGKLPLYGGGIRKDVSYMMDDLKVGLQEKKVSHSEESDIKAGRILYTMGVWGVQMAASFFYAATHITLVSTLVVSPYLTDRVSDPNIHRIVFLIFSAVASAACALLVPSVRYRKLVASGAILLVFSCLSASLVTSSRFMYLPYGVMAGSAYGILRTVSLVASADVPSSSLVGSVAMAILGQASGGILGTFVYFHFMTDYLSSGAWTNNFRILELVAVLAMLMGSMLRRRSVLSRRAVVVLCDPGFYTVAFLYAIGFVAFGVLHYLMPVMPGLRSFSFHKYETFFNPLFTLYGGQWVGAACLAVAGQCCGRGMAKGSLFIGGVFVFLVGVAVMPHDAAYKSFWAYWGLSLGTGFGMAFAQTLVTVGVARRVGGPVVGVAVSLLMYMQDAGTMFGVVAVDHLDNGDFNLNASLYMSGGFLLFVGLALIVAWFNVRPLQGYADGFSEDNSSSDEPRTVGIENPGMSKWDPNLRY